VLELPEWMFDLGACRYLNIAVAARVSCGSLRALKTLLESFVQLSGSLSLSQLTPTRNPIRTIQPLPLPLPFRVPIWQYGISNLRSTNLKSRSARKRNLAAT